MTTLTDEGRALDEILSDPDLDPAACYSGMGDPMYALASAGAIVVYGSSDLGTSARLNARDLAGEYPEDADANRRLADALEPMLEAASHAAEDANVAGTDPYVAAGQAAVDWLVANGLPSRTFVVERGWSRGPRVSLLRD